jgi:hypothetical protein
MAGWENGTLMKRPSAKKLVFEDFQRFPLFVFFETFSLKLHLHERKSQQKTQVVVGSVGLALAPWATQQQTNQGLHW